MNQFLSKIWKRRVVQFSALYLGVAWVLLQVAIAIEDTLDLPDWVDQVTLLLLAVGFPLAVILAWAQQNQSHSPGQVSGKSEKDRKAKDEQRVTEAGEKPTVIVLPFLNLSDEADKNFLADGITEDLISGLSQSKHLSLSARSISFSYKGRTPDIREVGAELGISYVVEGSIRPLGTQIRINVQLIEAATGKQLWARKLDQPLEQLFDAQDEMITRIAAALGAQLTVAEAERAAKLKPDDLTTWQAIQRSLWVITHTFINKEEVDAGIARLQAAVEKNPEHVYARAALAWFLVMRAVNYCSEDLKADWEGYSHQAGIAASMMGDDPYAMMLVGNAFIFGGKAEDGKAILERAIVLNPGSTDPYPGLIIAKCRLGDYSGARASVAKARELSPSGGFAINFDWFESMSYGMEGNFERAMPMFSRIATAHPKFPAIHLWLAVGYAMEGNEPAARQSIANLIKSTPAVSLPYLKLISYTSPDLEEHLRRIALIEPYWPAEETSSNS